MTRPALPAVFARRASIQVEKADAWWRENRPAVPDAVRDDVARALAVIASQPGCGTRALNARLRGVRRVYLPRIDYFLYYRASRGRRRIEILAFWHAKRGSEPRL